MAAKITDIKRGSAFLFGCSTQKFIKTPEPAVDGLVPSGSVLANHRYFESGLTLPKGFPKVNAVS